MVCDVECYSVKCERLLCGARCGGNTLYIPDPTTTGHNISYQTTSHISSTHLSTLHHSTAHIPHDITPHIPHNSASVHTTLHITFYIRSPCFTTYIIIFQSHHSTSHHISTSTPDHTSHGMMWRGMWCDVECVLRCQMWTVFTVM